jgi:predicted GH43/DUF377 family glycosyl hydrolase
MNWKKLGKIFDPFDNVPVNGPDGFAQSPQALVFGDFVRIYFSTRKKDPLNGKYLSNIAFADFDKNFSKVLRMSESEVIPRGNLGCFDEHGIFPMNVLRHGDKIYAWTCGWNRRVSVSVDTAIGFAMSDDSGLTFKKYGEGPVMAACLNEPFLVGDPFVIRFEDRFHMFYIYGLRWIKLDEKGQAERVYKIAHAVSDDGREWARDGSTIISDRLGPNECQALPTVIYAGGKYHMYFCYRYPEDFRSNRERGYRLGYATSADMRNWLRDDSIAGIDIADSGWDSEMQCYPHLFSCDGNIYLLYNGNNFGRNGFGIAILEDM